MTRIAIIYNTMERLYMTTIGLRDNTMDRLYMTRIGTRDTTMERLYIARIGIRNTIMDRLYMTRDMQTTLGFYSQKLYFTIQHGRISVYSTWCVNECFNYRSLNLNQQHVNTLCLMMRHIISQSTALW